MPSMLKLPALKVLSSEERRLKPSGSMTIRISTRVFMLMAGPALLMPTEPSMDYSTVLMPMSGVSRLVDLRLTLLLSLIKLLAFTLKRRRRLRQVCQRPGDGWKDFCQDGQRLQGH